MQITYATPVQQHSEYTVDTTTTIDLGTLRKNTARIIEGSLLRGLSYYLIALISLYLIGFLVEMAFNRSWNLERTTKNLAEPKKNILSFVTAFVLLSAFGAYFVERTQKLKENNKYFDSLENPAELTN